MLKVFTFDNIWFIVTIALLTLWLTIVTSKGGLTNNTFTRKWWERITPRGYFAIFIGILIALTLAFQEINSRNVSYNNSLDFHKEQSLRDTKITEGVNVGVGKETNKLFKKLSIAFKKQGLQVDTVRSEVRKLRDSIKTTVINGEDPLIILQSIKVKDSSRFTRSFNLEFELRSVSATSYNIRLRFDLLGVLKSSDKLFYIQKKLGLLNKDFELSTTQGFNVERRIDYNSLVDTFILHMYGQYKKSDGKIIYADKFYTIYPKKQTFGAPSEKKELSLREYISATNLTKK